MQTTELSRHQYLLIDGAPSGVQCFHSVVQVQGTQGMWSEAQCHWLAVGLEKVDSAPRRILFREKMVTIQIYIQMILGLA